MARKKKESNPRTPAKGFVLSVRFPPEHLPQLDAYVKRKKKENPGLSWTRSSAGLNLILQGLFREPLLISEDPKQSSST